ELGTPVTLIHGYVQGVQEGLITIDQPRYLEMVVHKINILDRLINDLSDLSKWEAGSMGLNKDYMDLFTLKEHIYHNAEVDIAQGNRKLAYFETSGIDERNQAACYIDVDRLDQVMANLIWNAIKHTSEEDGEIGI